MFAVAAFYQDGTFHGLYHIWYYPTLELAQAGLEERKQNTKGLAFMPILEEMKNAG